MNKTYGYGPIVAAIARGEKVSIEHDGTMKAVTGVTPTYPTGGELRLADGTVLTVADESFVANFSY